MADGLTVPFALAAGLSAAITTTDLIVAAGLAEVTAGAIAMGLGGFLAARADAEHYANEERREHREIIELRDRELNEVRQIFSEFGPAGPMLDGVVAAVAADPDRWTKFMMKFELGLEKPERARAPISAITIGTSYIVGGLIPLAPYIALPTVNAALPVSVALTTVALLIFGAVKGQLTGGGLAKSSLQTLLVGGVAAGAAIWLASLFG
jgi:VIT1/CCC1 family predicted Fe2+/Mn2+ transporter